MDVFNNMGVIVFRSRGHRRRSVIRGRGGDVGRWSCFRLGTEIKSVETLGGSFELKETLGCVNFDHPPQSWLSYVIWCFLPSRKSERTLAIPYLLTYLVGTKVSNVVGRHNTLVAVNLDGMSSWTNIVNVSRVGEKIYCALAVKEEEVRVDGGATAMVLGDDNDTRSITAHRGVIRLS